MQQNFFDNLEKLRRAYIRRMDPICEKYRLTRNELVVIHYLSENPERNRAADIVTFRGMAKSHVSMSISQLEQQGKICRHSDPEDRRTVQLELTAAALPIAEEARQVFAELEAQIYDGVTPEEWEAFQSFARKVSGNIARVGLL